MNSTAIIVLIVCITLIVLDVGGKFYLAHKNNKPVESNEKLLSDFIVLVSNISRECLEILEAEKTMKPDDYEDMLAKKVLDTFKKTVGKQNNIYVIELINTLPDEFVIRWIKDNVFTLDEFANSINEKLKKDQPEQVNILKEINKANE